MTSASLQNIRSNFLIVHYDDEKENWHKVLVGELDKCDQSLNSEPARSCPPTITKVLYYCFLSLIFVLINSPYFYKMLFFILSPHPNLPTHKYFISTPENVPKLAQYSIDKKRMSSGKITVMKFSFINLDPILISYVPYLEMCTMTDRPRSKTSLGINVSIDICYQLDSDRAWEDIVARIGLKRISSLFIQTRQVQLRSRNFWAIEENPEEEGYLNELCVYSQKDICH